MLDFNQLLIFFLNQSNYTLYNVTEKHVFLGR